VYGEPRFTRDIARALEAWVHALGVEAAWASALATDISRG